METNTTTKSKAAHMRVAVIEIDVVVERTLRKEMRQLLHGTSCTYTVVTEHGPGGGHPVVRVSGPTTEVRYVAEERYMCDLEELLTTDEVVLMQANLDWVQAEIAVLNVLIGAVTFAPTVRGDVVMDARLDARSRVLRDERDGLMHDEAELLAELAAA